jgi:molecular chaperone DnaJ
MSDPDYYKVLGVSRDATREDVLKAYRQLARRYHPDLNPGDKAAERQFTEVQQAFDVLGDPEKREQYDRYGTAAFQDLGGGPRTRTYTWSTGGGAGGFEDADLGEIFGDRFGLGDLFGRRGAERAARPGAALRYELEVPFRTAVMGGQTEIQVTRRRACPACKGTGAEPGTGTRACPDCGGSGRKQVASGSLGFAVPCPTCAGRGQVPEKRCSHCAGAGLRDRTDRIRVTIPAGIDDGATIRLRGQGQAGAGGQSPGDLLIQIRVAPHPYFRRSGVDLTLEVPITVAEAVLGAKIDVPTLEGTVSVTVPPGTSSGRKMRLRGKGVPGHNGRPPGDQYVEIRIVVPEKIDDPSKTLVRQFDEHNRVDPRAGLWD